MTYLKKKRRIKFYPRFWFTLVAVIGLIIFIGIRLFNLATSVESINSENETIQAENEPVTYINYLDEGGRFELPVQGASGYTSINTPLYARSDTNSDKLSLLLPGQGFTILKEIPDWWLVTIDGQEGWIQYASCFINLPDVIPSIIYDNTNAYASLLKSSEIDIPNITGQMLYLSKSYNKRLSAETYTMPIRYNVAIKIDKAQQLARSKGQTLILYEAFRPASVQKNIVDNFSRLIESNDTVREGISRDGWSMGWFISTGISNHQRGAAIDVGLGEIISDSLKITGDYEYSIITDYKLLEMPTTIHDLSVNSVAYKTGISSSSDTAWRSGESAKTMTIPALFLREYCTSAGLTPLASEWWHFTDLDETLIEESLKSRGDFLIENNYSLEPFKDIL